MVFVKVVKTPSYFSRFQVKPRRRREGKTDYQARRALIAQDKTKYNSPKYRFVVRITNTRVICQVIYATIQGDRVVSAADSTELKRYGMPVGLTNYAAAYATGLLLARRTLKKFGLDEACKGVEEADGEVFHIEEEESEQRPFKCALDIGLVRTTTGHRVFGAMKGAVDGGLHIPHSEKRFPGFTKEGKESNYDPAVHRERIFAGHVAEYMKKLEEEDKDKYESHFSRYIAAGIQADSLEETIKKTHAAIRADPDRAASPKTQKTHKIARDGDYIVTEAGVKYLHPHKLTRAQRKVRVQEKIAKMAEQAAAAAAAEDEE